MKKLLLASLSILAAVAAYGQGQVNFQNTAATLINTNGVGAIRGANAFRVGLYTGPAGSTASNSFTLVGVATNSSLVAGRFSYPGGVLDLSGNTGTPIAYQVRAWSLTSGASYEAAVAFGQNGWGGVSTIGGVTPAVNGAPAPSLFSSTAGVPEFTGQLASGFNVVPLVPEPSSIALGLLGLGAIALFRRRK